MRRPTAITVIVAFLLALLAPARSAWSCPDGTPCVSHGHGEYTCRETRCAEKASSCCVRKSVRCKHGAIPDPGKRGARPPVIGNPDHCRFHVSAPPQLDTLSETAKLLWLSVDVAPLLAPPFRLSVPPVSPTWRSEFTLGYRPPPVLSLGPSRAPPTW